MNKKSHDNLAEVIARMNDPKRAADGLKSDRNRIAKMLREARIRVKANKAIYDGIYTPDEDYDWSVKAIDFRGPNPRD